MCAAWRATGEVRNDESRSAPLQGRLHVGGSSNNGRVVRETSRGASAGTKARSPTSPSAKKAETAVFQAQGARSGHVAVDRRCRHHDPTPKGRIDYMNPVAESLTGWESREAQSQLIGDVLTVVDDGDAISRVRAPRCAACAKGQVLGLAGAHSRGEPAWSRNHHPGTRPRRFAIAQAI